MSPHFHDPRPLRDQGLPTGTGHGPLTGADRQRRCGAADAGAEAAL